MRFLKFFLLLWVVFALLDPHPHPCILFYILTSVGDEEENRFLAKRKMLGNIKFIGELGKLEMLHDSILHRCCEQASSSISEIIVP